MILIINAGSSSLKYALFNDGKIFKKNKIVKIGPNYPIVNYTQAWEKLFQGISPHLDEIKAVGHRVVHGGEKYREAVKISAQIIKDLEQNIRLAPLHMPAALEVIGITQTVIAKAPHYAIFDTAFFSKLSERAYTYPLPIEIRKKYHIRRYGFHGISHQYALRIVQERLGLIKTQRTISVHLGASSSMTAIKEGMCVDASMGFTPLEGLPMMTRCGDIDPGIILFLLQTGMTEKELTHIFNKESGLYGISSISDNINDLLYLGGFKVEDGDYVPPREIAKDEISIEKARLAIDIYVYKIVKYIGAYTAVLGGLDTLVFTGFIGSESSEIRDMVVANLGFVKDYEVEVVEPNEEEEMEREVSELISSHEDEMGIEEE